MLYLRMKKTVTYVPLRVLIVSSPTAHDDVEEDSVVLIQGSLVCGVARFDRVIYRGSLVR